MSAGVHPLSDRIARVLALDPSAPAVEFERHWYSWGELAATADALADEVRPRERVAVLLRNRPAHVALVLGLWRSGACVVTVNPERGDERVRADLVALGTSTVAGEPDDLEAFAPRVRRLASARPGVVDSDVPDGTVTGGPAWNGPAGTCPPERLVAVEMLTSGTTGPPKRVPLTYETLDPRPGGRPPLRAAGRRRGPPAQRCRRGQLTAGAPRRHLPGVAVRERRPFVLPARALLGRGSGPTPCAATGPGR
ncbi:MAG: hypothetical protein KatS3mg009_3080 [Acidimicrobiia bacterium]|nr:MAG: hypothetical protein KatS3mg009_3080 [Acidimicrobiia bacterium]